jgi:putative membrane protein
MQGVVDSLMNIPIAAVPAYFSVGILALIVFLSIFEWITKYDGWDEIAKGNVSAAMATGGKIFGICNIFRFSIQAHQSIYESLLWAGGGFLLLLAAYFLFEFLTPVFRIDDEIAKDNRAVGLLAMIISISLSYIIGAALT